MGEVLAFQAVAVATPEMRGELLAMGLLVASYARWIGWGSALVPGLAGWLGALPHFGHLRARQGVGAAVAGLQIGVILGCLVAATWVRDIGALLG